MKKQYNSKNKDILSKMNMSDYGLDYLNKCNSAEDIIYTLNAITISQKDGFVALSQKTNFGKESLYKSLSPSANARFGTILKIIKALGYDIKFVEYHEKTKPTFFIRENSIAHKYPNMAIQWDYDKNGKLTPNDIMPGSKKNIWWKCNNNHEWKMSTNKRITLDIYECIHCEGKLWKQ